MARSRTRNRRPEAPERLEGRLVRSGFAVFPGNTIDTAAGVVARPGDRALVRTEVLPRNLTPGKPSTIIGLTAAPAPRGGLRPAIEGAAGPAGPLGFRPGAAGASPGRRFARGYARVSQAGPLAFRVAGLHGTSGAFLAADDLPGDLDGDGTVNFRDLRLFQHAYLSTPADALYNPSADANKNGFVGHGDARFLLRNLPPVTPKTPLSVDLALAPGQYASGTAYENSGGITHLTRVTVVGHTTPGSIVFSDSGLGDYTFTGAAVLADEDGNFAANFTLDPEDRLKNTEFLVIDPYGQQTIRAFPILLIPPFVKD
jgi:hypothetical protein